MGLLGIETIKVFGIEIHNENSISIKGEDENEFVIIYKNDYSLLQTKLFYKIINPTNSLSISNIYFFSNIRDSIIYYQKKSNEFFKDSLIIITTQNTNIYIIEELKVQGYLDSSIYFNFYHRNESPHLIALYLKILNIDFDVDVIANKLYITVRNLNETKTFTFKQAFRISISIKSIFKNGFYRVNKVLKEREINQFIDW